MRAAALVVALLALDRVTKAWALGPLKESGPVPLLPFLDLTYVENTGAAFGLARGAAGANWAFVAIAVALIGGLHWARRSWPKGDPWLWWGVWLVTAGALGNLYDRLAYRFVVDFIHIHYWPVFNAADSYITVGACLLAWGLRDEEKLAAAAKK